MCLQSKSNKTRLEPHILSSVAALAMTQGTPSKLRANDNRYNTIDPTTPTTNSHTASPQLPSSASAQPQCNTSKDSFKHKNHAKRYLGKCISDQELQPPDETVVQNAGKSNNQTTIQQNPNSQKTYNPQQHVTQLEQLLQQSKKREDTLQCAVNALEKRLLVLEKSYEEEIQRRRNLQQQFDNFRSNSNFNNGDNKSSLKDRTQLCEDRLSRVESFLHSEHNNRRTEQQRVERRQRSW